VPDTLRVVTFSTGGRPVVVRDLNSAPGAVTAYFRERDSFQFTPAASTVQYSKTSRRYGGARAVGEVHDNASIAWTAYVRGATLSLASANVEALIQNISDEARGRYVEWAPEGGLPSYMEIAGPGAWTPTYNPVEFVQTNAMRVQLSFPVLPLVQFARMNIGDPYDVDSTTDYTFDALAAANAVITGGVVTASGGSLTSERRVRHTIRGHTTLEGQATVKTTPLTTITSYKMGVLLRATSSLNYVEVYVDDNGTNSRLRIDVIIAGARTNRSTTNLAARLISGNAAWVRGRIENNGAGSDVVYAEYWSAATGKPTPMGTPTLSANYSLVGGDAPLDSTRGYSGWSWIPQNAGATLDDFEFLPFTYRNLTWPRVVTPRDTIQGFAPALAEVVVTPSGGAAAPAFALIGWGAQNGLASVSGSAPLSINSAVGSPPVGTDQTQAAIVNWASTADAGALTGNAAKDATVSGIETYSLSWTVDPTVFDPDDFTQQLSVEVWARMAIASTVVTPTVTLSAESGAGPTIGSPRYSNEWGTTGRVLTVPTGTIYRLYRLGTILLPDDTNLRRSILIKLTLVTGAGSTGTVSLDYGVFALASSRALSPSGKLQDSSYPSFVGTTSQLTKIIRTDLSALAISPTSSDTAAMPDHGLGGSLITVPVGVVQWLMKLSNVVPDDPAPTATADQLTNSATLTVNVTPRSYFLRAS
jgi:hypothetical protein